MQVLRTRRPNGKLPNLSAPKLAKAVDPTGQLTEGAIASCIHDMRVKISNIMQEKSNVVVGRDKVIANNGRGYHLADRLVIEEHDTNAGSPSHAGSMQGHDPAMAPHEPCDGPASVANAPSERQQWILDQLESGIKLKRQMVQKHFGISEKQAKRELADLSARNIIDFTRKPRPGYYVLKPGHTKIKFGKSEVREG